MTCKSLTLCALSAALVAVLGQTAVAELVANGDFETAPSGAGWTFSTGTGPGEAMVLSATDASAWGCPGTGQVATLYGTATIGQTISGFDAGNATFTFSAMKNSGVPDSTLTVTLDGAALQFGGAESVALNGSMLQYTTDAVAVTAGSSHTIVFQVDNWAFLDNVSVATVPEPSSIALLTAGLFGLLAYAWRKR